MDFDTLVLGPAFAVFGRDAAYTPEGGSATACRVVLANLPAVDAVEQAQVRRHGRQLEVRKAEIAAPAERGVFSFEAPVLGHSAWRVAAPPRCEDPDELVWTMVVVPA